jgi:hypothetical protein
MNSRPTTKRTPEARAPLIASTRHHGDRGCIVAARTASFRLPLESAAESKRKLWDRPHATSRRLEFRETRSEGLVRALCGCLGFGSTFGVVVDRPCGRFLIEPTFVVGH